MKKSIIRHGGLIQPIVARRKDGKLLIVAGERRWRGASRAWAEGREIMLAVRVVDKSDDEIRLIQLEENARREDLHPLDEAEAYQELLDTLKGRKIWEEPDQECQPPKPRQRKGGGRAALLAA